MKMCECVEYYLNSLYFYKISYVVDNLLEPYVITKVSWLLNNITPESVYQKLLTIYGSSKIYLLI